MNFSAVILAGGKSSRMGRDKAFLEICGRSLLARQVEMVRAAGAGEILISGRANADYSTFNCRLVRDKFAGAGPLAGIERALAAAAAPLVLVLAVDLPKMTAGFLRQAFSRCTESTGVIPRIADQLEPLAAFYPKTAHPVAEKMLNRNSCAVKDFAGECVQSGLAVLVDFAGVNPAIFKNCNSPADLA